MPDCNATIHGPHVPGQSAQCTRDIHTDDQHIGPKTEHGRALWTDYFAGATPHREEPGPA